MKDLKALDVIEKLAARQDDLVDDARKEVSFASDEDFIRTLSDWAARRSRENPEDVYAAVEPKLSKSARARDMIKAAFEDPAALAREEERWK